jgi:hypothetical protein
MTNRKPIQEELLESVAGGLTSGIPTSESNTAEFTKDMMTRNWEEFKQQMEWNFKDKELELKAKQMWLDAAMKPGEWIFNIGKTLLGGK